MRADTFATVLGNGVKFSTSAKVASSTASCPAIVVRRRAPSEVLIYTVFEGEDGAPVSAVQGVAEPLLAAWWWFVSAIHFASIDGFVK